MGKGLFSIIFIALAGSAIVFQGIGFFSHAWMIIRIDNMEALVSKIQSESSKSSGLGVPGVQSSNPLDMLAAGANPSSDSNTNDAISVIPGLGPVDPMSILKSMDVSYSMGIWYGPYCSMCMDLLGKSRCINIEVSGFDDILADQLKLDYTSERVLCTLAIISSVFGVVFLFLFIASEADKGMKAKALICGACWTLSALLVLIAVGLGADQQSSYLDKMGYPAIQSLYHVQFLDMQFPWAILMSGIGGFLSLGVVFVVVFRACKMAESGVSGNWMQFTNNTV